MKIEAPKTNELTETELKTPSDHIFSLRLKVKQELSKLFCATVTQFFSLDF